MPDTNKERPGNTPPIDRESLSSLYPTPETYEQRRWYDLQREELFRQRRPRHPQIKITIFVSLIFCVVMVLLKSWYGLWMSGLAGVALSFGAMIGIATAAYLCGRYVRDVFYVYGKSTTFFVAVYISISVILLGGVLNGWFVGLGAVAVQALVAFFIVRWALGE